MNVLMLGANGMMEPHVVKALEGEHTLRVTDINDLEDTPHEYLKLDISNLDEVVAAAEGMDAIMNLAVLRPDRQLAFDVNARGCYNVMVAALEHGIRRVINTGPEQSIYGRPTYMNTDFGLNPDVPPHPGTHLYYLSKSLGMETCRVFAENHDVHVIQIIVWGMMDPASTPLFEGGGITPFFATWSDVGQALRCALTVDLDRLPSRFEIFTISAEFPYGKFSHEKAQRILGWKPSDNLERFWRKPRSTFPCLG